MTLDEIISSIKEKGGVEAKTKADVYGVSVGVPSSRKDLYHWSLVPISDESRPRFVDFMVSLIGKEPDNNDGGLW